MVWFSHFLQLNIQTTLNGTCVGKDHIYSMCRMKNTHTHTHPFNGPFSGTTRVRRYKKGKTNLDFTEARDSEWQWHQLGHMQVCTSLQTDNHASNPPLSFLQARCPSCRPTNSVKALKGYVPHVEDMAKIEWQYSKTLLNPQTSAISVI